MCCCVNQALEKWHLFFGSVFVIHIKQKKPKNPTPTHPKEQKVGILICMCNSLLVKHNLYSQLCLSHIFAQPNTFSKSWVTYISERRTSFAKTYGTIMKCYGEHVGNTLGTWGTYWEPNGTHWELKRNIVETHCEPRKNEK